MTHTADLIRRLREKSALPFCPYDRRSPEYWTAPDDKPCRVCGTLNDSNTPDKCTGADSRIMTEAADALTTLQSQVSLARRAAIEDAIRVAKEAILQNQSNADEALEKGEHANCQVFLGRVHAFREVASTLERISPILDVDALVEKWARIMWIDTSDKDYWDHVDDVTRNIYRSNALAILTELLG